jgi:hypothetical protein
MTREKGEQEIALSNVFFSFSPIEVLPQKFFVFAAEKIT